MIFQMDLELIKIVVFCLRQNWGARATRDSFSVQTTAA